MVINTPTGSGARSDGYEIRTAAVRHGIPCITTMTGASAAARAIVAARERTGRAGLAAGAARIGAPPSARAAEARPLTSGCSRRSGGARCEVVANEATGGYRIISALDREGPMPARRPVLHARRATRWGGADGRPYLPRAFSVADGRGRPTTASGSTSCSRRSGPGTERLAALARAASACSSPARSAGRSRPRRELAPGAAGAILVGGGIGIAPLAILRRRLADRGVPQRVLLGFRDREHSGGLELFRCSEVRTASEDGHPATRATSPTCSRCCSRATTRRGAVVYACGPPAMLEAVRALCAERGVAAELAMETPMACGFGSCFGCAVPLAGGGYMRLCVDGPTVYARTRSRRRWSRGAGIEPSISRVELCGIALEHPIINGSGTFDAIAARRAFGDAVDDRFPFSAFVSKTITPEPRAGNPPPRLYETPAGMINSIGLPNKGLEGFLADDLPAARARCPCR